MLNSRGRAYVRHQKELGLVRDLADGSYEVLREPAPGSWHVSLPFVPKLQWSPRTGISRYEWARRQTPRHQLQVFEYLQRLYREEPPRPLTREEVENVEVISVDGVRQIDHSHLPDLQRAMIRVSVDGWNFSVMSEQHEGFVLDVLLVSNDDWRTFADWELAVRFRSWVLTDGREAAIRMPGFVNENLKTYVNDRANMLQIVSIR